MKSFTRTKLIKFFSFRSVKVKKEKDTETLSLADIKKLTFNYKQRISGSFLISSANNSGVPVDSDPEVGRPALPNVIIIHLKYTFFNLGSIIRPSCAGNYVSPTRFRNEVGIVNVIAAKRRQQN